MQTVIAPIANFTTSQASAAITQGTIANGPAIGGVGGYPTAPVACADGAITAIAVSASTLGNYTNGFGYYCRAFNSDGSLGALGSLVTVFAYQSIDTANLQSCPSGKVAVGFRGRVSSSMVTAMGLICGNAMSGSNVEYADTIPSSMTAGTVTDYICDLGKVLVGFTARTGNGADQVVPRCATYTGFVYAAVGAPSITSSGPHTATISFSPVSSNYADTPETYTVTAVPSSGTTITATGMTSPIVLTGLGSNMSYTISVTGLNNYGTSAATGSVVLSSAPLPGSDTDTALYFDGNTYVKVADSNDVDLTNAFTFQAWVKPETMTSYGMILNKEDSVEIYISGGYYGIAAQSSANKWGYFQTGVPAVVGEWHHIAYTRAANSTSVSVFLDSYLAWYGVIDTDFTGTPLNTTYPLMIGGRSGSGSGTVMDPSFKGLIDHVAVYSVERTQAQIESDMQGYISPSAANLQLYYDFNEGSGDTLYNRKSGSTSLSDMTLSPTPPLWTDVKIIDPNSLGSYTTVKFPRTYITQNNGWKVPDGISKLSYLVVAGGGAGGGGYNSSVDMSAGGGGGGGVRMGTITSPSGYFFPKVGPGQVYRSCLQDRGRNSSISGSTISTISATGGGSGGCYDNVSYINGNSGGSGGGAAAQAGASQPGSGNLGGYSPAEGFSGGAGQLNTSNSTLQSSGGGGGAAAAGGAGTSTTAGAGGAGIAVNYSGTTLLYGSGGGGARRVNNGGGSASNGGGSGGSPNQQGNPGTYGQGGGGGGTSQLVGNAGGFGVVYVRWMNIPTYTKPTNAYLNVGMTETFTTNVAQDSATVAVSRTFKWESTTPTANGAYTLIKQGTGAANAAFSWLPTDTSTSGSGYLYRLTVTDSDTAGLFITDSSTAYAVINRALVVSGSSSFGKTINLSKSETYTITLGTPTYTASLSPTIAGITLDTSTAGSAVIKISETMTVGTYYETLTVTDSVSASVVTPLTIVVAGPPQLTNSSEIVTNGLVFNFDASNSASFNFNTGAMSDISGAAKPVTRVNTNTYSAENLGVLTFSSTSDSGPYAYFNKSVQMPKFAIETYIRLNGSSVTDHFCPLVSEYTSGVIGFALCIDSARTFYSGFRSSTAWTYKRSAAVIPMNTWTHLVGTFDGSEMRIYLNGNLVTSYASTNGSSTNGGLSPFVPSTDKVYINRDYNSAAVTPGNTSYGFIRLYDVGFSLSEVTQNLEATRGRFLSANNDALTPSHKYGNTTTETYTITSGYGSDTISYATGNKAGVKLETTTSLVTLKMQESLTATTHYETITVTDSLGASTFLPIKMTVSKADTLTISMDTKTVVTYNGSPITSYPKPVIKGLAGLDTFTVTTKFSSSLYTKSAIVPTNSDTYTVIAEDPVFGIGALSNYVNVVYETSTAVVNKAKQPALSVFLYGGTVGLPFPITVSGGGGDGAISETVTAGSSMTGCAISNHSVSASSTSQGFCRVYIFKAASQNYLSESITVDMYFMAYINNQPTGQVGSGSTIAINGVTSFETSTVTPPGVTSLSSTTISLAALGEFTINGSDFDAGGLTVKFYRNKTVPIKSSTASTITFDVSAIRDALATSGRIVVITVNGEAVSPQSLTITP